MNRKTWKWLIGILVVLAAYVLIVERPFTDYVRGPERSSALLLPNLDPAAVTALEVKSAGALTRLEKDAGSWVVATDGRFPADQKAVTDLLAALDTLTTGMVASVNPENRATFGVDESGLEVTLEAGSGRPGHFHVGNSTPDYSGLFLRLEGEDRVFAISGINRFQFDRGAQTWRDKKIVPHDAELVRSVSVTWGDTTVVVTRAGGDSLAASAWTVAGTLPGQASREAQAEPARQLARTAAGLTADGFPAPGDSIPADWGRPALVVDIEVQGGDHKVVEFGPTNDRNQHYVRRTDSPAVYLMGTWRVGQLKKTFEDLAAAAD